MKANSERNIGAQYQLCGAVCFIELENRATIEIFEQTQKHIVRIESIALCVFLSVPRLVHAARTHNLGSFHSFGYYTYTYNANESKSISVYEREFRL